MEKFNLNFKFSQNLNYKFLPRPHFTNEDSIILNDQNEISKIKNLKIYVSLKNLFSLKDIKVNNVILENANINLNNQNYDFFSKLLKADFKNNSFEIRDSNVFFKTEDDEVLFINKIINIKYFYDLKNLNNIVVLKNEIFNIPYQLKLSDDKTIKKIFSELRLNLFKLKIENELDYSNNIKKGSTRLVINQNKSSGSYVVNKNSFIFSLFDKANTSNFLYKVKIEFNPFYSKLQGSTKEIDLSTLFNSNALLAELLKSEILNNINLNFNLDINANKFRKYQGFNDIFLNSKIKEGLIDIDNTKFYWKDYAKFKILDSLIHVKNSELVLDGKLEIIIKNSQEIYKTLLTPKNYRTEIEKIELNFNYNFDQKILKLNDIRVDNVINKNVGNILKNLFVRSDKLQNKIYFKNMINKAIKSYAG
ncbi:MAG: hypothetical protein HN631_00180 [Flavobacteriaceae bacterium]|nr:hypothetical protein [Flavobacteriaceae bacterium]